MSVLKRRQKVKMFKHRKKLGWMHIGVPRVWYQVVNWFVHVEIPVKNPSSFIHMW